MVARLGIESMYGMPEIALGISGLSENSDRDDGIKTNLRALRKRCGGNLSPSISVRSRLRNG